MSISLVNLFRIFLRNLHLKQNTDDLWHSTMGLSDNPLPDDGQRLSGAPDPGVDQL